MRARAFRSDNSALYLCGVDCGGSTCTLGRYTASLFFALSRCLFGHNTKWQPQFPTRRVRAQPRGAGSAVRNRTSRNGQLDLTRRDGPWRATSTRTIRRCPWRLGYGSAPPLQGASRGRESFHVLFDSTRRAALRTKLSSIRLQDALIEHKTLPCCSGGGFGGVSRDSSWVMTRGPRKAVDNLPSSAQRAHVIAQRLSTREQL